MNAQDSMAYMSRDEKGLSNKLWLLVEYRTFSGKISHKNYEVIEAKDVCGPSGPDNANVESMHTGKIVHIRGEKGFVQATIVTISDDKCFLDTELKDMRQLQLEDSSGLKKRKRDSSIARSGSQYVQYQNWNGKLENDQSNQSILVSCRAAGTKAQQTRAASPPMTFCQQTQTDFKCGFDGLNSSASSAINEAKLTKIIQSQTNLNLDVQLIKGQVADMNKQLVDVKLLLNEILAKCSRPESRNGEHEIIVTTKSEPFTPTQNRSQFNPPKILNLSHSSNVLQASNMSFNNAIIEPVEASNDSNYSFSYNSRMSLNASNQSIYQNDSPNCSNGEPAESKMITQSMSIERLNGSHTNLPEALAEEDGGDPNDEVVIGNNATTIPRHILSNINWNSHTAATRRLLRVKFTREVLATHSLTGKPSPGKLPSLPHCI